MGIIYKAENIITGNIYNRIKMSESHKGKYRDSAGRKLGTYGKNKNGDLYFR